jgi:fatty acid-binding protein DegV
MKTVAYLRVSTGSQDLANQKMAVLDYARQRADSGAGAWSAQHIGAPDQCAALVERGTEVFGHGPTIVSEIGPVLAAHTGPGLLGIGALPERFVE